MTTTQQTVLRRRLVTNAAVLAELSEDEVSDLLAMVGDAQRSRRRALFAAIDEALQHLPRLLRGTARKILLGER